MNTAFAGTLLAFSLVLPFVGMAGENYSPVFAFDMPYDSKAEGTPAADCKRTERGDAID